jgi:hypothetical protein
MTEKKQKKEDPAIQRVRAARHKISAEHGHDPNRVVAYYMKRQQTREKNSEVSTSGEE